MGNDDHVGGAAMFAAACNRLTDRLRTELSDLHAGLPDDTDLVAVSARAAVIPLLEAATELLVAVEAAAEEATTTAAEQLRLVLLG